MKNLFVSVILCGFISSANAQEPMEIWGVTQSGGNGFGALFKTDSSGNNPILAHSFDGKFSGKYSNIRFHEAGNDKLYATISTGGTYDDGIIVELDPVTGKVIEKAYFNSITTGYAPNGMALGSNGKFYGTMVSQHAGNRQECVFEYDIVSNTIIKKTSFNASTGVFQSAEMLLAKNGKLYGTTRFGGKYNFGILYEYDITADSIIKKIDFDGSQVGGVPGLHLVELDNKLYGCTLTGGIKKGGTIYEYDIDSNTLVTKYKMDGTYSILGLTLGDDGLLYGTTQQNPINQLPQVFFKFDPVLSNYTVIRDFDPSLTGFEPSQLKKCKNGLLYGLLSYGGLYKGGNIFEYDPVKNKFKIVFSFKDSLSGINPFSVFEQAKNGKLYSGTFHGGKYGDSGVLFEFDIVYHSYKKLQDLGDGFNGDHLMGSLSLANNGKIYTVAYSGGQYDLGVLLECDPSTQPGTFTKKFDFSIATGVKPVFAPVQGANGKLYGTTSSGGNYINDNGTLYEYDPSTNTFHTKFYFSDLTAEKDCYSPGGLVQASNNKMYGVTFHGGKYLLGVLFEFNPASGTCTKRADIKFDSQAHVNGQLLQAKNGKLYGLLKSNVPGMGALFEYNLTSDSIVIKAKFENMIDPSNCIVGSLVEGKNGKLYGIATPNSQSPSYLFEYDPSTELVTSEYTFKDSINGLCPAGQLLVASNGNVYGMTNSGGTENRGVMYEYNYTTHIFTKKFDFKGPFGMKPYGHNNLIEVCKSIPYQGHPVSMSICETKDLLIQTGLDKKEFLFQWYKDGVPVPFATSNTLTISTVKMSDAGAYYCAVSNGCRLIETDHIKLEVLPADDPRCAVGVHEQSAASLVEIYPNPANDYLKLQFSHSLTRHITVEWMDLLGKLIQKNEYTLSNGELTITLDTGFLPKGIYTLRISDAEHQLTENKKLIKQ